MMRRLMRDLPAFVMILMGGLWCCTGLTGCNTVEGVGEDIEDAGESIDNSAEGTGNNDTGDPND